jgi:hypothetical protein
MALSVVSVTGAAGAAAHAAAAHPRMIATAGISLFIIANTPLNQQFSLRFLKALSAVCSKCITLTQIFFAQHCSARAL